MTKMFAALLIAASLVACGGKKESTTPVGPASRDATSAEHKDGATGGATYGGTSKAGSVDTPAPRTGT